MSNLEFTQIYKLNYRPIFIFISRTIKDKNIVEELTNDVFMKALNNMDKFDSVKSSLTTWLHNIAKNTIIDHFRTCHDDKYILVSQFATEDNESGDKIFNFADTSTSDTQLENKELHEQIKKSISSLSPKYRFIAKLYFNKQMKYSEIATFLEIPEGSVKGMIFRVREMLQSSLKEYATA
jgi:RNA polymerase sigma-70 factor (ECF subfamily)